MEAFLEMLAAERGAAALTVAAYRGDLDHAGGFLARGDVALERARTEDLRRYLGALARAELAPRSVARKLSALRQFYRFLVVDGVRRDDPSLGLDGPRPGRPLPKTLGEDEVAALIAAAGRDRTPAGLRLRCILELLYASGLRISELVRLPPRRRARGRALPAGARQGRQGAPGAAGRTRPARRSRPIAIAARTFSPRARPRPGSFPRGARRAPSPAAASGSS